MSTPTIKQQAVMLAHLVDLLADVYDTNTASLWARLHHDSLGGVPLDMALAGREAEVLAEIDRITSGAYS